MTKLTTSTIGVNGNAHGGRDTHAATSMAIHQGEPTLMAPEPRATEGGNPIVTTNKTEG